jgi:hypothetical protein
LFEHGIKCSGTEQNVLVRAPNDLACNIPPVAHFFLKFAKTFATKGAPPVFTTLLANRKTILTDAFFIFDDEKLLGSSFHIIRSIFLLNVKGLDNMIMCVIAEHQRRIYVHADSN